MSLVGVQYEVVTQSWNDEAGWFVNRGAIEQLERATQIMYAHGMSEAEIVHVAGLISEATKDEYLA